MIHFGDITKIQGDQITPVDVITFGSPCQDVSVAGQRSGIKSETIGDLETTRSGLFYESIRIIKQMREGEKQNGRPDKFIRPRFIVFENVPGLFSSNSGKDFQAVLTEIVRIAEPDAPDVPLPKKWSKSGIIMGERFSIAWRVHDAQFWGATQYIDGRVWIRGTPQRRKRIALVADFNGHSAPEVLFERKSCSGYFEESGEAR